MWVSRGVIRVPGGCAEGSPGRILGRMSTPQTTSDRHMHELPSPLAFLGEFVYIVDLFVIAMMIAVFVIGGLSPFESPVMTVVTLLSIGVIVLHQIWYRRHRTEIERGAEHRHARERRGF